MKKLLLSIVTVILFTVNISGQTIIKNTGVKDDTDKKEYVPGQSFPHFKYLIGQKFVYFHILDYTKDDAPYPYKDGRIRNARFLSSEAAFREYCDSMDNNNGKTYTVVDLLTSTYRAMPAILLKDEDDNELYQNVMPFFYMEFIPQDVRDDLQKKIGATFVYKKKSNEYLNYLRTKKSPEYYKQCFINCATRAATDELPNGSSWVLKEIAVDPTFFGPRSANNDYENGWHRLVAIMHNDELGDYEVFIAGGSWKDFVMVE